jgi:putative flippase GtrA
VHKSSPPNAPDTQEQDVTALDRSNSNLDTLPVSEAVVPSEETGPSARRRRLSRLLRYTGVNIVSVTVDYSIFLGLTHLYDMPVAASIIAYAIALALNFDMSKRFVFGADGSQKTQRRLFTEFLATGLLGLVLTAVVTAIGVHSFGFSPLLSKTIAVLVCFVVLYIIRSRLVFTRIE